MSETPKHKLMPQFKMTYVWDSCSWACVVSKREHSHSVYILQRAVVDWGMLGGSVGSLLHGSQRKRFAAICSRFSSAGGSGTTVFACIWCCCWCIYSGCLQDERTDHVERLLRTLCQRMPLDRPWSDATDDQLQYACKSVERAVMGQVYTLALYPNGDADMCRDEWVCIQSVQEKWKPIHRFSVPKKDKNFLCEKNTWICIFFKLGTVKWFYFSCTDCTCTRSTTVAITVSLVVVYCMGIWNDWPKALNLIIRHWPFQRFAYQSKC